MHQDCLTPFRELVQNHPAMRPLLYPYLAEQSLKNGLTAQAYQIVVTNLAAKTGLTLPRILVAATEGARALDPKITAYTTRTALEEAGDGEPKHVHTLLMMRALNYHGKVAFDLPTLNLKEIQELQIVLDNATRLLTFQISTEGLDAGLVRDIELSSDLDGLEAATLKLAKKQGFADQQTLRLDKSDLQRIQADATATLMELGVLPEVIAYGQEELYAQRTGRVGYIQGVTFAGEAVADDMLLNLFKVCDSLARNLTRKQVRGRSRTVMLRNRVTWMILRVRFPPSWWRSDSVVPSVATDHQSRKAGRKGGTG